MIFTLKKNEEVWNLFTKREEYIPRKLDKHDRFRHEYSEYKDVFVPSVTRYLLLNGFKVEYPENKNFAVCLTHDVDDIYPPYSHTILSGLSSLKELDFRQLRSQLFWKYKGKVFSPYLNFKYIMELENKYDARSSFYFITAKEDIKRFRYNIEDLEEELGYIVDNGGEVGLHGGYYSYNNFDEILKEKIKLESIVGRKVIGYRNHYLRFKVPDSWELLSKAGFKYDTTFGYCDTVGFRNGICYPFKPYNLNSGQEIDLIEIPLVIMDGALFSQFRSLNDAWNCTKNLIDCVEKYKGTITLLWHNHAFNSAFREKWELFYQKILDYCKTRNAWMTSCEEVYSWWIKEYQNDLSNILSGNIPNKI